MSNNKKYKIISNIENDAPSGDINWCTISFLTPQKRDNTKYLNVYGFKVHNGYNSSEIAEFDAKAIKDKNNKHDVYISQLGKLYAWDDATKTDNVSYDNNELNELEGTRRQQADKIKLMAEQAVNEHKTIYANTDANRLKAQRDSMRKKLYDKGMITKQEYELMQNEDKPQKEIKAMASVIDQMNLEMDKCVDTDYLDENEPTALKFGCLSIYSPKRIGGLKTLCFKIRGMYQSQDKLQKRIKELHKLYPNDRIYTFEIGKWCPYCEDDSADKSLLDKKLNYAMKCHLDSIDVEEDEFLKRKDTKKAEAKAIAKSTKRQNRREKRKALREAKAANVDGAADITNVANVATTDPVVDHNEIPSLGNAEEDAAIRRIFDYLDDPELKNKYVMEKSKLQTMAVDM